MVNRDTSRDSGAHLFVAVRDVLDVDIGCHRGKGDNGVQNIVKTADNERDIHREHMVCEAIEEAHDYKN